MVQDIDLAELLLLRVPMSTGMKRLAVTARNTDLIEAVLIFANGCEARFVASRAAEKRKWRVAITYKSGEASIVFFANSIVDGPSFGPHADFAKRLPEPIGAATADYVNAIVGKRLVAGSAEDGAAAVTSLNPSMRPDLLRIRVSSKYRGLHGTTIVAWLAARLFCSSWLKECIDKVGSYT
jgi:hypothetical protein